MPENPLTGKVALVTGGARRTGRVLSKKLAAAGASVVVNARSSKAEAESLVRDIESAHGDGDVVTGRGQPRDGGEGEGSGHGQTH